MIKEIEVNIDNAFKKKCNSEKPLKDSLIEKKLGKSGEIK